MFSAMVNDGYCFALGGVNWRTGSVSSLGSSRLAVPRRRPRVPYWSSDPEILHCLHLSLFFLDFSFFFGHIYLVNWTPSL